MKLIIAVAAFLGEVVSAVSQEADTVFLGELIIPGIQEADYAQSQSLTRLTIDSLGGQSLTDLLLSQLPLQINQYGARGQLASINLRGLGPSRTSLLWNNMEINSYTTGQSDMSLISDVGLGSVTLLRGGSAPLSGNGALGGTISIEGPTRFGRGVELGLGQSVGSFGLSNTTMAFGFGTKAFVAGLQANYLSVDNDFKYSFEGSELRQTNAAYKAFNIVPYLGWILSPTSTLKLDLWYSENDRQVQPGKGDMNADDHLKDRNWRGVLNYFYDKGVLSWESQLGFTRDWQVYNEGDPLVANRLFVSTQSEVEIAKQWTTRIGANVNAIDVRSAAHEEDATEIRNDLFASVAWRPSQRFNVKLNLRQPMSEGQLKPFSPSLSMFWTAVMSDNFLGGITAEISRGFRLPTFNDRYWRPGGNLDLLSETSHNLEAGLNGQWEGNALTLSGQLQFFRNDVDNWILWIPGGRERTEEGEVLSFWYPDNVRRVLAHGAEFQVAATWKFGSHQLGADHRGSWTRATNQEAMSTFDRSKGKQLPYTPEHIHLTSVSYQWRDLKLQVIRAFTSKRFTEANNELPPLPAYTLYNLRLANTWRLGDLQLATIAAIRNLTDVDYESFENRAMPGINLEFTLQAQYRLP